ncbi:hypothetical protein [Dorea sp. D27]|uniref:hypothetical protein n=1 Tax=Dorea sp. D27 TaxID=658665 RepID=UPI0006739D4A|nr:hypothetical protein [Dorea sp. D27]
MICTNTNRRASTPVEAEGWRCTRDRDGNLLSKDHTQVLGRRSDEQAVLREHLGNAGKNQ